jgi:Flp pilus assembly protein CpaB
MKPASTSKRPKPLVLVAGVVLVILAFAGVTFLGGSRGGGSPAPTKATIMGAARDLRTGQAIAAEDVTTISVDFPPTGAKKTPSEIVGKILRSDVKAKEPIIDANLAAPAAAAAAKLYFALPAGKVAMNIPAADITPYVQPGDQIDIMATPRLAGGTAPGGVKTKLAMKNVPVLSVGVPGTPTAGNLIVAVTPAEAEAIQFVIKNADFTYVLRSPLDHSKPEEATSGVDINTFRAQYGY